MLREQVEYGVHDLREQIPSLSRAPTAGYDKLPPRQYVQSSDIQHPPIPGTGYEWLTDSTGRKHLIQVESASNGSSRIIQHGHQPPAQDNCNRTKIYNRVQNDNLVAQNSASRNEEDANFRVEYRCSPTTGRTWRVRIPVSPVHSPQKQAMVWEWRIDPHTGQHYQIEVPQNSQRCDMLSTPRRTHESYENHGYVAQNMNIEPNPSLLQAPSSNGRQDKTQVSVAGIYRVDKSKKTSSTVEFARNCPAKWAKTTTNNTINLPLYAWSTLAEIEAAMSGRLQPLNEGELIGKLRHLKNTMEVCCLNSSGTDFSTYGWTIAKDYAFKVEDEIAQGLATWQSMAPGIRTNSLVSAQMDCPRYTQKPNRTDKEERIKVCTTYNKCKTKNKCEYEMQYPDKQCQRKHECSWCRSNSNQSNRHQEWDCKKKEASG